MTAAWSRGELSGAFLSLQDGGRAETGAELELYSSINWKLIIMASCWPARGLRGAWLPPAVHGKLLSTTGKHSLSEHLPAACTA